MSSGVGSEETIVVSSTAAVQVSTLCYGQEQLIAPASSFHLPSTSHCCCANTAGCANVSVCMQLTDSESYVLLSLNP